MRRIGKIAAVAMVASIALTGCGNKDKDNTANGGDTDSCPTSSSGPKVGVAYDGHGRGDKSFNDAAWEGLKKAMTDFDISCVESQSTAGTDSDTARAERLSTLADQGLNPVIGIGYAYSAAAAEVAPQFPDVNFAVIDGYTACGKVCGLPADQSPNLVDLTFTEEQGSYLVGVAAGLKSSSHKVGFIGGNNGPLISKFAAGFEAGVQAADPSADVETKFLTTDPGDINTAFYNPTGAQQAADGMLDKGVDVIFAAAGQSGGGVFTAVSEKEGAWVIGVDSDQYLTATAKQQPHVLTSMLKRVDTAVYSYISDFVDENVPTGAKVYDLAHEGVGYSTSGGFVDDIASQIDEAAEKVKSGEVKVPTELMK